MIEPETAKKAAWSGAAVAAGAGLAAMAAWGLTTGATGKRIAECGMNSCS